MQDSLPDSNEKRKGTFLKTSQMEVASRGQMVGLESLQDKHHTIALWRWEHSGRGPNAAPSFQHLKEFITGTQESTTVKSIP